MAKHQFPSTPQSIEEDFPGLQQILQHNAMTPYHQVEQTPEHDSLHTTTHSSPASGYWMQDQMGSEAVGEAYQLHDDEIKREYGWPGKYEPQYLEQHRNEKLIHHNHYMPTPASSEQSAGDGRTSRPPTRSGNYFKITDSAVSAAARPKKPRNRSEKPKIPTLHAPLSVLTRDSILPLRDMDAWVNRSYEERHREVEKRKGYIPRPMNSFMLYRSAYAERTKEWCTQNNHQVVSSVSGESWPMEPPEIRERYEEYARIERDNHQKAHPGYKFSPSKVNQPPKKRKGGKVDGGDDEANEDLDGLDYEWTPSGQRKPVKHRQLQHLAEGRFESHDLRCMDRTGYSSHSINTEAQLLSNQVYDSRTVLPYAIHQFETPRNSQLYYTTAMPPNAYGASFPAHIQHQESMNLNHDRQPVPSGLPGSSQEGLFGTNGSFLGYHTLHHPQQLDPLLMGLDENTQDGAFTQQNFTDLDHSMVSVSPRQAMSAYAPGAEDMPNFWNGRCEDDEREFKQWLEQNNKGG